MNKNQKCQVAPGAKYHQGRIGYFQFFGEKSSSGIAVLSVAATEAGKPEVLFAVKSEEITPID